MRGCDSRLSPGTLQEAYVQMPPMPMLGAAFCSQTVTVWVKGVNTFLSFLFEAGFYITKDDFGLRIFCISCHLLTARPAYCHLTSQETSPHHILAHHLFLLMSPSLYHLFSLTDSWSTRPDDVQRLLLGPQTPALISHAFPCRMPFLGLVLNRTDELWIPSSVQSSTPAAVTQPNYLHSPPWRSFPFTCARDPQKFSDHLSY